MLRYAIIFFVIAAAVLGFGVIAGASAGIAQIIFFIFLLLFVVGLVTRLMERVWTEMEHKAPRCATQQLSHDHTVYR